MFVFTTCKIIKNGYFGYLLQIGILLQFAF